MSEIARARLTIDLDALAENYRRLKVEAGAAEVAAVVKADAYGLGAAPVARRLWAEGARSFFVARLEEGELVRQALGAARPARILVLDGAPDGALPRLVNAGLVPVLNSPAQVEAATAHARTHGHVQAALHIDTGMNRLGLSPDEARALAAAPGRLDGLDLVLVMSHLACAGDPGHPMNARQADLFSDASTPFAPVRRSLANSGGLFLGEDYHFDLVRPGISLYGGGPFDRTDARIRTVVRLEAPILQLRNVEPGQSVGYGASFTADHPRRLAILAAGYANGVLRSLGGRGAVWFAGALRPIVGRVSMDLLTIDVTGAADARPGAMVEILGEHATLDAAAQASSTAAHELLVRLGHNLERVYLGEADQAGAPGRDSAG